MLTDPTKIAGINFMGVRLRQPASKSLNMKLRGGERLKRFYLGKGTEHQREWTEHINPIIDRRVVYTRERRGIVPKHYGFTNAFMPTNILENKNKFCQISHFCLLLCSTHEAVVVMIKLIRNACVNAIGLFFLPF